MPKIPNTSGLEKILRTIEKAREVMHFKKIFERMGPPNTDTSTKNFLDTSMALASILEDQKRKRGFLNGFTINQLNPAIDPDLKLQKLGDYLFNELRDLSAAGQIRYFQIPFLMEFAYTRVFAHFSGETRQYLHQYRGVDAQLPCLGRRCAEFLEAIQPPSGKILPRTQYDRLFAFLSYLILSEIDSPIQLFDSYKRFEEAMAFCKSVPEKFLSIMQFKKNFGDSWRRYKRFIRNKKSEYYKLVIRMQDFEQNQHPQLYRTVQAYILNKYRIDHTMPFILHQ